MKISGHKTREVFDRYNIVDPDDLKQAATKIGVYHEKVTNTVTIADKAKSDQDDTVVKVVGITG